MYNASLSVYGYDHYLTVSFSSTPITLYLNSKTRQLKYAKMASLLCYMVIKQAFEYKTKGICDWI